MQSRSHDLVGTFYANDAVADLAPAPPVHGRSAISAFWAEGASSGVYVAFWQKQLDGALASFDRYCARVMWKEVHAA